jgi:ectoine hydroxylase-related dioxygenase (phytanoyl-CoA dioxygenase family)
MKCTNEITFTVPCHNDSTFLYTDPPSAVGFWIALEPCTAENGALVSRILSDARVILADQLQRPNHSLSYRDLTNVKP